MHAHLSRYISLYRHVVLVSYTDAVMVTTCTDRHLSYVRGSQDDEEENDEEEGDDEEKDGLASSTAPRPQRASALIAHLPHHWQRHDTRCLWLGMPRHAGTHQR